MDRFVRHARALARLRLRDEDGYHHERSDALSHCPSATYGVSWTLLSASAETVEIEYHESWRDLGGCPAPPPGFITEGLPTRDCEARYAYRYELVRACEAPCEMRTEDLVTDCFCP